MSIQKYSINELKQKVKRAIARFLKKDSPLLDLGAHEQAISHRLAVYLENLFDARKKLNVDCEYNKHLKDSKKIDLIGLHFSRKECTKCSCKSCEKILEGKMPLEKHFRPDIVVHSRGSDNLNLIAIEMKTDKRCPFDEAKLIALTKPKKNGGRYGYQLGVFLHFPKGKPTVAYFFGNRR